LKARAPVDSSRVMKIDGACVQLALGGVAEWGCVHLITRATHKSSARSLTLGLRSHGVRGKIGARGASSSTATSARWVKHFDVRLRLLRDTMQSRACDAKQMMEHSGEQRNAHAHAHAHAHTRARTHTHTHARTHTHTNKQTNKQTMNRSYLCTRNLTRNHDGRPHIP
jgi:hypothetical protein